MVRGLIPAPLGQLERRAAREVRHEAVEKNILAVVSATHSAAERGRAGRVQREGAAVDERCACQYHRVRRAPFATVAPCALHIILSLTH